MKDSTFKKDDAGKLDWSLLPGRLLEGVVRVLMFGAKKYERWNWAKGCDHSRYLSATKRHIDAYENGEDLDPESSLHHIDHALCSLIFLRHQIRLGVGNDDRITDQQLTTPSPFIAMESCEVAPTTKEAPSEVWWTVIQTNKTTGNREFLTSFDLSIHPDDPSWSHHIAFALQLDEAQAVSMANELTTAGIQAFPIEMRGNEPV